MSGVEMKEKCKLVAKNSRTGKILYSSKPINFYLVDPVTSEIIEENHPLRGEKVKNRVLVIPSGKGSSVVQLDGLYQLLVNGNNPAAIIIRKPDPVIVSAAFICDVPIASGISDRFFDEMRNGGTVRVDHRESTIEYMSD